MHPSRTKALGLSLGVALLALCLIGFEGRVVKLPEARADVARTTLYIVRHCEDLPESVLQEYFQQLCTDDCCLEPLNDAGAKRAEGLAKWFQSQQIVRSLTHIVASHKLRTLQTVENIAAAAIEAGAPLTLDDDLNPGDRVQQVPSDVDECSPGFESSSSSLGPMLNYLEGLPLGSRAVVAGHSTTIYPIMDALGIDTSDPELFPRNSRGRVQGFGNLWVVDVNASGQGRLRQHRVFELELVEQHDGGPGADD